MRRTRLRFNTTLDAIVSKIPQDPQGSLRDLSTLKAKQSANSTGVDFYRAIAFLHSKDALSARQAFLEETRRGGGGDKSLHTQCWDYILRIEKSYESFFQLPPEIAKEEPLFATTYLGVFRYSMLHWQRLLSL